MRRTYYGFIAPTGWLRGSAFARFSCSIVIVAAGITRFGFLGSRRSRNSTWLQQSPIRELGLNPNPARISVAWRPTRVFGSQRIFSARLHSVSRSTRRSSAVTSTLSIANVGSSPNSFATSVIRYYQAAVSEEMSNARIGQLPLDLRLRHRPRAGPLTCGVVPILVSVSPVLQGVSVSYPVRLYYRLPLRGSSRLRGYIG